MSQITKKEDSEETNEVTENDNSLFKYIKVAEDEGEEPIEIPCENDHTILLTTLTSLFPGASGLKYRTVDGNTMRGLRNVDGRLQPPEEGWATIPLYYCCFPKENKRKIDDSADNYSTKTKRLDEKKKISDLIVLGLPWKTTDKELREYFEQFGELVMAQVKRDPRTGDSKGFGFIRFVDQENQSKVILKRHSIGGRFCDVRVPMSKDGFGEYRNLEVSKKIFIGRLTEAINYDDLKEYFSKYGEIADIFIPKPFRGFAFVTFRELDIAQSLCGEDHIIKGISVHVSNAVPKFDISYQPGYNNKYYGRYPNNGTGSGMGGGGGSSGYSSSYVSPHHNYSQSHLNMSPSSHHHPSSYQHFDYYSRNRSNQHSYHDQGSPYSGRYSHQYNESEFSPYY
ncbi:Tensin-3 [Sarcoptes scabiei]|nr:Tensin-3 [Sarcoptes scabiei]